MEATDKANQLLAAERGAEAIAVLEAASHDGDGDASHMLSILMARGAWTARDWPRALELLRLAAAQGSPNARTELALIGPTEDPDALFAAPAPTRLCESPRVRRIDGFLSPAVCDFLIARGRGRLERAATLERNGETRRVRTVSDHRTNSAVVLSLFDGGVVMALIAERIGRVLEAPTEVFEGPQLFHYATGEAFRLHVDYIEGAENQRVATFLVYLNEAFEGGETWFPEADLKARPATGGALFFHNVDPAGAPDPLSVHAGAAPTSGEKWLLSQWVRERRYTGD